MPLQTYTRHAASGTMSSSLAAAPAPLTVEEYFSLFPSASMPPTMLEFILSRYRAVIETELPFYTDVCVKHGARLKAKGFRVPDRFLPQSTGPSKEDLLRVVAELYRKLLTERYA